mgnify:CR=1 FL=1
MNKLGLLVATLLVSAITFAQNTTEKSVESPKKTKKLVVKSTKPPVEKEIKLLQSTPLNKSNGAAIKVKAPAGTLQKVKAAQSKKAVKK